MALLIVLGRPFIDATIIETTVRDRALVANGKLAVTRRIDTGRAMTTAPMWIFVAGASGVVAVRLVPLLVAEGHTVAGMTRRPANAEPLRSLGALPVVCDVYDARRSPKHSSRSRSRVAAVQSPSG